MKITRNALRQVVKEELKRSIATKKSLNESHFAAIGALSQKASTPEMQKALAILEQALTKAYAATGFALKNAKSMDDAKAIKGALSHALKAIEMKSDYAIHNLAIAMENKPEPQPEPVAPEDAEKKVESALGMQPKKSIKEDESPKALASLQIAHRRMFGTPGGPSYGGLKSHVDDLRKSHAHYSQKFGKDHNLTKKVGSLLASADHELKGHADKPNEGAVGMQDRKRVA